MLDSAMWMSCGSGYQRGEAVRAEEAERKRGALKHREHREHREEKMEKNLSLREEGGGGDGLDAVAS